VLTPTAGASDEAAAAWLTYAFKKILLFVDAEEKSPGSGLEPSFTVEQQAFGTMLDFWREAQTKNAALSDEDLDFLQDIRRAGLLDAFLYIRYFRPEFADSYARWRVEHAGQIHTLFDKYLVVIDPNQVAFRQAVTLMAASDYEHALPLFEQSAHGFIQSRDPGIKDLLARNLALMARTARVLGRTDVALAYQLDARAMLHQLGAQQREADVINSLALTMTELGRLDEALALYEEALTIDRARHDTEAELTVFSNLGSFYLTRGDTDRARDALQEALARSESRRGGVPAALYSNLGTVASELGSYKEAFDAYEKGLAAAVSQRDLLNEVSLLGNLGELSLRTGQIAKAKTYLEDALKKARALKEKESEATFLNGLGTLALQTGDGRSALRLLSEAYSIRKQIQNRPGEAVSLLNLGGLSSELGDETRALAYWRDGLDLARELKDRHTEAALLNNIASHTSNPDQQLTFLSDALSLVSAAVLRPTAADPYPTPRREDLLSSGSAEPILANRGLALLDRSRKARAAGGPEERQYLAGAVASLRLAVDLIEEAHRGTGTAGLEAATYRISYLSGKFSVYDALVSAELRLHDLEPGRSWDRQAFAVAERSKSRTLLELLNESKVKAFSGIPPEELRNEKQYELRMGALETEIAKPLGPSVRETLSQQLDRLVAEFETFKKDLRTRYPNYAALKYPEPASIETLQPTLDARTAVIEYFVGEDFIVQWLITNRDARVTLIRNAAPLLSALESYRRTITQPNLVPAYGASQQLYRAFIGPIEGALGGITRLIIVPDGPLARLPFEALVSGMDNGTPRYMVEKYAVSYAQSSSVLTFLNSRPAQRPDRQQLFAIGRPQYPRPVLQSRRPPEIDLLARRGDSITADLYPFYLGQQTLRDLPATEREVDSIGNILHSSDHIFKGAQATEWLVKDYSTRGMLRNFKYVHFATHGLLSDEIPALTSVALAVDKDKRDDGFLTLGEVYGLELDSDLVTLSACGLGLGKMERGEGVVGLTRAFMYAGTAAVAVSLWKVGDNPTALLMERFYTNLERGTSQGEALQQAQLEFIRGSQNHPYNWAAFVLYGASR
jgi:CHAT domain-containing protein/Flp pilus assembly protein TadD